jgi:PTH1 family peptidyl-tRNA hydrolase
MHMVVGLGNPGRRYAATRHNVGFMVIERLARRWRIAMADDAEGLRIGTGRFAGGPVMLVEPQQYMNRSGETLAPLRERVGAPMIVVHDELDIPFGQLRVKRGGGSGGHRGVTSLAAACGAEFDRVRVGVGRPAPGEDAVAHVLSPFTADEQAQLDTVIERAADAVEVLINDGLEMAMNRFNQRVPVAARANAN